MPVPDPNRFSDVPNNRSNVPNRKRSGGVPIYDTSTVRETTGSPAPAAKTHPDRDEHPKKNPFRFRKGCDRKKILRHNRRGGARE